MKKRYLWVIEAEDGGNWKPVAGAAYSSRKWAEQCKMSHKNMYGGKERIVKYVPEALEGKEKI